MTMLENAVAFLAAHPDQRWSLNHIRQRVGITLRAQYRLSQQLMDDPRVDHFGANVFQLKRTAYAARQEIYAQTWGKAKTSVFQLGREDYQRGEDCPSHYPERASGWYAAENDYEVRQDEEMSKFNRTRR